MRTAVKGVLQFEDMLFMHLMQCGIKYNAL